MPSPSDVISQHMGFIRLEATIAATALSSQIVGKAFACLFDKPEFGLESPSVGEE